MVMATFGTLVENPWLHADMALKPQPQILRKVNKLCEEGVIPTKLGMGVHTGDDYRNIGTKAGSNTHQRFSSNVVFA